MYLLSDIISHFFSFFYISISSCWYSLFFFSGGGCILKKHLAFLPSPNSLSKLTNISYLIPFFYILILIYFLLFSPFYYISLILPFFIRSFSFFISSVWYGLFLFPAYYFLPLYQYDDIYYFYLLFFIFFRERGG